MASTRQQFVWGWGRLPRASTDAAPSTPPLLSSSAFSSPASFTRLPRLLEALETSTSLRSISAASHHLVAVTNSGEAYTWGPWGPAVIGDDSSDPPPPSSSSSEPASSPPLPRSLSPDTALRFRQIYGVDGVYQVAVLTSAMYAITAANDVFGWRWSEEEGEGDKASEGEATVLPHRALVPAPLPALTAMSCTSIACGPNFALFLTSSGLLFTLGSPCHAPATASPASPGPSQPTLVSLHPLLLTRIAAGFAHAAAITHTGELLTWGCSLHGRLGNGRVEREDVLRPMPVGGRIDAAVVDVACGYGHTLALDVEGRVWAMGSNARGQCGWGEEEPGSSSVASMCAHPVLVEGLTEQVVAISAGAFHSAAITAVSELLVWGWNRHGQLGLGGEDDCQPIPAPVAALTGMDVRLVSCAADYTVAVTDHFMSIDANYFASSSSSSALSSTASDPLHASFDNGDKVQEEKDEEGEATASSLNASTITRSTSSSITPSPDTPAPVVFEETAEDGDSRLRSLSTPTRPVRKVVAASRQPSTVEEKGEGERSLLSLVREALLITPLPDSLPDGLSSPLSPPLVPSAVPSPMASALPKSSSASSSLSSSSLSSLSFSITRRLSSSKAKVADASSSLNAVTSAYLSKLQRTAKEAAVSRLEQEKAQQKEERQRAEETRRNAKREKAMEDAALEWTKTILPRWSEPKVRARAREMVEKQGVPTKIRGQVWPVAIGNQLMVNAELYKIVSERANRFKAKKKRKQHLTTLSDSGSNASTPPEVAGAVDGATVAAPGGGGGGGAGGGVGELNDRDLEELRAFGKAESISYIDVDLARTFPSLAFFQEECGMHEQLRSILYTFCFYRPDVGYVQGMSYLAAYLLLYCPPFKAFVCFCNLLSSPYFHCFLKLNARLTQLRYAFFQDLLHDYAPQLSFHLTAQGVTPDLFLLEWCMTLFCKRLKLDVVGRVWDLYILEGEVAVYRVAVGVLMVMNEGGRMLKEDMGELLRRLGKEGLDMEEERLMGEVHKVQVSEKMLQRLQAIIDMNNKEEEAPI